MRFLSKENILRNVNARFIEKVIDNAKLPFMMEKSFIMIIRVICLVISDMPPWKETASILFLIF